MLTSRARTSPVVPQPSVRRAHLSMASAAECSTAGMEEDRDVIVSSGALEDCDGKGEWKGPHTHSDQYSSTVHHLTCKIW